MHAQGTTPSQSSSSWLIAAAAAVSVACASCGGDNAEPSAEKLSAARTVVATLDALATVTDDGKTLTVRFDEGVVPEADEPRLLQLMTAVADADAVLEGRARPIAFLDPTGHQIGFADPSAGVNLGESGPGGQPPRRASSRASVNEWSGVHIDMPADDVLLIHPREETTADPKLIGTDAEGKLIQWSYPGAHLTMARRHGPCPKGVDALECYCYRVIRIDLL